MHRLRASRSQPHKPKEGRGENPTTPRQGDEALDEALLVLVLSSTDNKVMVRPRSALGVAPGGGALSVLHWRLFRGLVEIVKFPSVDACSSPPVASGGKVGSHQAVSLECLCG